MPNGPSVKNIRKPKASVQPKSTGGATMAMRGSRSKMGSAKPESMMDEMPAVKTKSGKKNATKTGRKFPMGMKK
jgi:hypothetical protein